MNTIFVVVFPIVGLLIAWRQFRVFPWKQKPSTLVYLAAMLIFLSAGAGFGVLAGGWLAGQFGRIAAGS